MESLTEIRPEGGLSKTGTAISNRDCNDCVSPRYFAQEVAIENADIMVEKWSVSPLRFDSRFLTSCVIIHHGKCLSKSML